MYLTAIQAREFRLNVCIYSICIQRNVSFALVSISFECMYLFYMYPAQRVVCIGV
jgi:hypothetical protein